MSHADIKRILAEDERRRQAREIADFLKISQHSHSTYEIVNPNAPAWRNPELHVATHVEPTHAKRPYKRTRAQATKRPRNVPAFAGSLSMLDAARTGAIILTPNAVKVIRTDGTTEIVPTSHYKRNHTRQTHTTSAPAPQHRTTAADLPALQNYSTDS